MCDNFSGEDLLKVLKDLNVQLFDVDPNVIRGWFDTDEKDMKYLLSWMCANLTSENYMHPLELAEYNKIETPLTREKYEQELACLKLKYPGILDAEYMAFDIEILEDELNLMNEEEQRMDNLILSQLELERNLQKELSEKTDREITASLKLKEVEEHCYSLAKKLDELNIKHYQQLQEYGENLYSFDLNPEQNFINNTDPEVFERKFQIIKTQLTPALEESLSLVNAPSFLSNRTCPSISNTFGNDVNDIKYRIISSLQNYMVSTIEKEKVMEMVHYLYTVNINDLIDFINRPPVFNHMDLKEETRNKMYSILEEIATKKAEHETSQSKLNLTQQELKIGQTKLENLSKLEDMIKQLLSYYLILNVLYNEENEDIQKIELYFKNIYRYVMSGDLQNCIGRINGMNEIIEEYNSRQQNSDFKLIQLIVKILSNEDNVSLERAFQIITEFKRKLKNVENSTFACNMDYKALAKNVSADIKIIQSFLKSSSTVRIVVIPDELQKILRETEEILNKQENSVRTAIELTSSMKKRFQVKWDLYKRQLWMYFLAEPQKLKFVLQQIQEEFAKSKPQLKEQ